MRIYIIGPTASGKSTLGKKLAKFLRIDFYDTDKEIEKRSGADIPWIFDIEGEEGFRKREKEVLLESSKLNKCVIATGGGIVLSKDNRDLITSKGLVVYLQTSIESQLTRTKYDKSRPLLQGNNKRQTLEKLELERRHLYEEISDISVNQEEKSQKQIIKDIVSQLRKNSYG